MKKMSDNKGKGAKEMAKFTITLTENYNTKTYRLTEDMFMDLSVKLEPYRSAAIKSKPVRCIETGKIYDSAMMALRGLNMKKSYSDAEKIKKVCKGIGRREEVFGYHWQYVNDNDRKAADAKVEKLKRHNYYATLKNENNSRSYKITEELFLSLSKYLEPNCTSIRHYSKSVMCVETAKVFVSIKDAARWINLIKETDGCNGGLISRACSGKLKTAYGFHWKYADKKTADVCK